MMVLHHPTKKDKNYVQKKDGEMSMWCKYAQPPIVKW